MPTPKVFISYRRNPNDALARLIHKELHNAGADTFLDVDSIHSGRFESVIRQEILNRDYFLIILAPETLQSEWVRKELLLAIEAEKVIIPLMMPGFDMNTHVPAEVAALKSMNGIPYSHHFADAALDRVKEWIGLKNQPRSFPWWAAAVVILLVGGGALLLALRNNNSGTETIPTLAPTTLVPASDTPAPTAHASALFDTTATQVFQLLATATESLLQRTVDAQQAINATLLAENTSIAATKAAQSFTSTPTVTNTPTATNTPTPTSEPTQTLPPAPATSVGYLALVVLDPGVNLAMRQSPDSSAQVLMLLPGGTSVQVVGRTSDSGWLYVTSEGNVGWVSAQYVILTLNGMAVSVESLSVAYSLPSATANSPEKVYPCDGAIVSRSSSAITLNVVRTLPRGSAALQTPIHAGAAVRLLRKVDETTTQSWYQISESSGTILGWIPEDYIVPSAFCPT